MIEPELPGTLSDWKQTLQTVACVAVALLPALAAPINAQETSGDALTRSGEEIRALLTPVMESTLSSQISGKIRYIGVRDSERFKRYQRLLEFDCEVQKAQLQKAQAELLSATKKHEANLRLQEFDSVSQLDVETSAADAERARAEQAVMQARIKMCVVYAPYNGRVVKVSVNPYESVTQGQELISILDDSHLKLELYVPSKWLSWLETGTAFKVQIDETGKTYPATVTALGAKVDPVSHSVEITAEIQGSYAELLAGMSGVARFPIPQ